VPVAHDGSVERRSWVSRTGMEIAFEERSGAEQLVVSTNGGAQKVTLKQTSQGIEIRTDGPVDVVAQEDLSLRGSNVSIEASGNLTLKGLNATVEGTANAELKAANTTVDGAATTTVTGAMVRIN